MGLLPEIRLLRRQHAGPLLEGAPLPERGHARKEELPECYTITGLTAANILETSTPDEFKIPVKTKTIGELTDDDIFTLVSVTNLEIMCKDGAYTNCTDGYSFKDNINPIGTATAPRWDVAPLMCYDNTGRTIYMLTNTAAPGGVSARAATWISTPSYRRVRARSAASSWLTTSPRSASATWAATSCAP